MPTCTCVAIRCVSLVTYHSLTTLPASGRYASGFVDHGKWGGGWISFRDVFSVCVAVCRIWRWGGEVRLYGLVEMADAGVTSEVVFFLYRDLATGTDEESHVNNTASTKISVS